MKIILGIILFMVGSLLIKTAEESVLESFSDAKEPQETEGDDEAPEIGEKTVKLKREDGTIIEI